MMSLPERFGASRAAGIVAVLAALVLGAVAVSGCDRSGPESMEQAKSVGSQSPTGEAASCASITDCQSYLSCIDGTCQEPGAVTGRHESDTPVVTFVDDGQEVASFYVELATTPAEQQKGLMYRREMQDDWGMLFIYPDEAPRSFWMENTFISLDMVFIDGEGRVLNILEAVEPLTRTQRRSKGAARYVLELEAGRADAVGLAPGQRMQLENVDASHRPRR